MSKAQRQDFIEKLAEYSSHYLHGILPPERYAQRYRELRLGYVLDYLMDIVEDENQDQEPFIDLLHKVGRYAANDRKLAHGDRLLITGWFDEITHSFRDQLVEKQIEIPPGMPVAGSVSRRGAMALLVSTPLLPFTSASAGYISAEAIAPYFTDNKKLQGLTAIVAGGAGLDIGIIGTVRTANTLREMPPALSAQEWRAVFQQINGILDRMERAQGTSAAK